MTGLTEGTTSTLRAVLAAAAAAGWRRRPLPKPVGLPSGERGRRYVRPGRPSVYITRQPRSTQSTIAIENVVEFDPAGLGQALNVLAAFFVVPAEHSPLFAAGITVGCDAVTDISVSNAVELRLDRLDDVGLQAELGDRLQQALGVELAEEPYVRRLQIAEICRAVSDLLADADG